MKKLSRENVLEKLSDSIFYGNLGMFIGAGFSKAVINGEDTNRALSWGELIKDACDDLNIDYSKIAQEGFSYPEIATFICEKYASENEIPYEFAKDTFKDTICKLTNWYPNKEQRKKFEEYFDLFDPSWIVTTNYDLVLESILVGKGFSIGPQDYLMSQKNLIPIYHLHGIRRNPESIIITQEDYVKLFRPNEYRQIKLALTIRESTTLILGYGLGDMNVLSAVDWSKNIYQSTNSFPDEIIQIVRAKKPKAEPYLDKNGIIILEIDELENFLIELKKFYEKKSKERLEWSTRLEELLESFKEANEKTINNFISKRTYRYNVLKLLSQFETEVISSFMELLSSSLEKVWAETHVYGAFTPYRKYLQVLLDIILEIDNESIQPVLFEYLAHSLNRVLRYVGDTKGDSWEAKRLWDNRKSEISEKYINELIFYAEKENLFTLKEKLKDLV